MGDVRLTDKMRRVLRMLARHKDPMPLSGPEISAAYGRQVAHLGRRIPGSWSASGLMALRDRGYVEQLGQSFTGAWCWRITDAGRAALAAIDVEK